MLKPFLALCALLSYCSHALGIINVPITPRHLLDSAGAVMVATVMKEGETWKLRIDDTIKGQAPAA